MNAVKSIVAVALGLVAEASAAGFVYVTPSDLQGRKVPLERRAKACEDANRYDLAIPLYRRLRDDASLPVGKRIGFAQAESRLCLVMVDRAGAVAALDAMIALKPERDKLIELRLAKASAYASQVGFREEFTPGMLKKAQEEIDAFDKAGGLDQRSRFDLVWRMAKAHLSSSEPINALKYAEERIAVMPLKPNEKGTLLYCGVKALKKTGRDDEAYELPAREALCRMTRTRGKIQ